MKPCLTLGAALALAACSGETKKETGGKAGGEILPASVSDAMLPRDTVRSQAPLAPKVEGDSSATKQVKSNVEKLQTTSPNQQNQASIEPVERSSESGDSQ